MKKLLSVFLLALLASCGQKSVNNDDEKKAIVKSWNDWEEKGKAGDPAFYWSDDAVIMGQGQATINGKAEFNKLFWSMQKKGVQLIWDKVPSILEVSKDGQMAYLLARNEMTITDSTGKVNKGFNQSLQIWKKDKEGKWKAAVAVMYPEKPMK